MQSASRRRTASDLPGLDIAERRSWQQYVEAALRFHAALNRRLTDEHQLSVIDLRVLDILRKSAGGAARLKDLASALGATPRHMTKRIRVLEERVLVRRESIPEDKRGVMAIITEPGRELAMKATVTYADAVHAQLISPMSRRQITTITENCWRIYAALSQPDPVASSRVMGGAPYPELPTCQLPGIDYAGRNCWHQLVASSEALFTSLNARVMAAHKLSLFDILLLDLLTKSKGGFVRMCELAETFVLVPGRVTQHIARLESHGLARRSPSPSDRRSVLASITPEGQARVRPALKTYAGLIRAHYLDPMSRQQMIALGDACRRISPPPGVTDGRRGWTKPDVARQ